MKNMDLKPVLTSLQKTFTENSSKILLGVGVTCSVSAIVATVPATVKAVKLIEAKKEKEKVAKLTFWETLKTTWHCYIPSVVLGTVSVLCVTESSSIESKRTAGLAAAYQITASALEEYQQQVVEKIGEKKEREIQDNVSKKRIEDNPVSETNLFFTNNGETLCYDSISGRYFKSDINKINKVVNDLNKQMLSEGTITLSDLYFELGLTPTAISDTIGWSTEKGLIEIKYGSHLASNNIPCLVLDYRIYPTDRALSSF